MYIENGNAHGPQVGGSLTRWHSHLVVCEHGKATVAGFGVQLGGCNPSHLDEPLHLADAARVGRPYPGGPFSDNLSRAATNAAARAVLAQS